ncbi:MAG: hypothetical protein GDA36_04505 [Rhodobacteraceae bacterium]|nr:hypothetical protein [Paracoccaceae bacterium]
MPRPSRALLSHAGLRGMSTRDTGTVLNPLDLGQLVEGLGVLVSCWD